MTLVSGTIGDYAALVVPSNSNIKSMGDLVAAYKANPSGVAIGGGSVPGGMDHLVAAMVMQAAGANPTEVKYVAYDAGGKAMAALLSGEIKALSTGFSEAVAMAKAGEANIIGVTSNDRVGAFPDAKTMKEQGIDTYFVNWRGFLLHQVCQKISWQPIRKQSQRCTKHLNGKKCVHATVGKTFITQVMIS